MGLTFNTSGAVVSGVLIGRDAWLDRFEASLRNAGDTGFSAALEEQIIQLTEERDEDSLPEPKDFYGEESSPTSPGGAWARSS